jgi:hypothetical protein
MFDSHPLLAIPTLSPAVLAPTCASRAQGWVPVPSFYLVREDKVNTLRQEN